MCSLTVLTVYLCLPPCLSSGDPQEMKVKPGEDVTLPCRSPKDFTVLLIQWTRADLTSDGNIYLYTDGQFQNESQHPSYRGRAELKDPEMKDGDVSVVLRNVTFNDTGTYQCRVGIYQREAEFESIVDLKVQVTIPAEPGQNVSLPCRAPNNTEIIAVNWTRPGLEPEYVLLIQDKNPDPDNQHPLYQNRVELEDGEMNDGDLSIILKNVTRDDTGTYECRVFHTKTHSESGSIVDTDPISIVDLQVHQPGDKEENIGDKEGGDKEGGDEEGGDKEGGDHSLHVGLGVGGPEKHTGDEEGGDEEGGDKDLQIGLGVGLFAAALLVVGVVALIVFRKHQPGYAAAELYETGL